jgi:cell division protein FtsW
VIYTSPHSNLSNIIGTSPEDIDNRTQGSDRFLLMSVVALMMFGILAVYSSIAYFAESRSTTAFSMVSGHIVKLGIAFVVMLIVSKINYHTLAKFSRLGIVVSLLLLVSVLIFGQEVHGAKRALEIAGFSFQPSMVATVALLLHLCVLLSEKQEYVTSFSKTFLPSLFWIILTCGLIGVEDFSAAGFLMALCLLIMFIGRISIFQIGILVVMGVLGAGILLTRSDERMSRVQEYLVQIKDINTDKFAGDEGRQAQQAQIAIAQGQLFGVGIGKSTQRDFLPAPYNDFIFAIIAEEYGIAGAMSLILIYTLILFRGIVFISRNAEDTLGSLLAVSCTLIIVLYGFVNAGVASGLLPVTGLPMPFVSYGGTSMVFAGLMIGILLNISKHHKDRRTMYYG